MRSKSVISNTETLLKYLAEDYNPYGYDITREEYAEQLREALQLNLPGK